MLALAKITNESFPSFHFAIEVHLMSAVEFECVAVM